MQVLRRRLAVLVAAALLAAPASAGAQSAGDDQYEDPFAGEDQSQSQGGSGGSQEPETTPEPAVPAPDTAGQAEEALPSDAPAASAAQQDDELPRTGADGRLILLAGTVLLAGGVVLRLRVRDTSQ